MSQYDLIKLRGKSLMYWAMEWFGMSNDCFYSIYGFNFNPHDYPGLYEEARSRYYAGAEKENAALCLGGEMFTHRYWK